MDKNVLFVFGTRPEALKMVPVIKELKKRGDVISVKVCSTAQHRDMLDQVLGLFEIPVDYDLAVMKENQDLFQITNSILSDLKNVLEKEKPDLLLVQGDTTTAFASSLVSFYLKIPIGHVEAGLRTLDKYRPFPEEMNRRLIGTLCDLHFAPTVSARERLLGEGVLPEKIFVTGNTIIDTLYMTLKLLKKQKVYFGILDQIDFKKAKVILVTGHRRESFGEGFRNICYALKEIVKKNPDVEIVYPVHLNPNVQGPVKEILGNTKRIHLIEPLDYLQFVCLMNKAYLILTDSGGIQEEGPSLGKPILVMREVTERVEGIEAGTAKLVGTNQTQIIKETERLLNEREEYERMAKAINPFGDGKASERIADIVLKQLIQ